MAPEKVSPSVDGRPVEHVLPAANLGPSQLTNPRPPATVAASKMTQAEGQGAWAWASAELWVAAAATAEVEQGDRRRVRAGGPCRKARESKHVAVPYRAHPASGFIRRIAGVRDRVSRRSCRWCRSG